MRCNRTPGRYCCPIVYNRNPGQEYLEIESVLQQRRTSAVDIPPTTKQKEVELIPLESITVKF
jgi:hypothetical protein